MPTAATCPAPAAPPAAGPAPSPAAGAKPPAGPPTPQKPGLAALASSSAASGVGGPAGSGERLCSFHGSGERLCSFHGLSDRARPRPGRLCSLVSRPGRLPPASRRSTFSSPRCPCTGLSARRTNDRPDGYGGRHRHCSPPSGLLQFTREEAFEAFVVRPSQSSGSAGR
jgi:hypothetical protein